ncbi:hypothetical protein [Nocardioides sp.]|uniref:hypothetical protein n=1 Tax=Nocardioides sp. TaxID=35761 RepID=UPI0025DE633A|nr:hypothetical protein [Nocardioides sp.]
MLRATAATLTGVVAVASLVAGCSSSEAPTATPSVSAKPRPTSVVQPTQDPASARLAALARLAEQAAAELPRARVAPSQSGEVTGGDISWPQCPKGLGIPERRTLGLPMPTAAAEYVVLGLTNGPGFSANPCLDDQVRWVRERRLMAAAYAVASYPSDDAVAEHAAAGPYDGSTRLGALANTGYQQALANVVTMRHAGLASPLVWVDVEPVPDFEWSSDREANAAVVEGVVRGYRDAGYGVGVYSTPALWAGVVGGLALGLPEWRAAGQTSRAEARERCGSDWSIQGGDAVLAQWVEGNRDLDLTCPGTSARMGRWFQQY